jgi:hypothetical protein
MDSANLRGSEVGRTIKSNILGSVYWSRSTCFILASRRFHVKVQGRSGPTCPVKIFLASKDHAARPIITGVQYYVTASVHTHAECGVPFMGY